MKKRDRRKRHYRLRSIRARRAIKGILAFRGLNHTQVAQKAGVSRAAVTRFILGTLETPKVRNELEKLGIPGWALDSDQAEQPEEADR